MGNLRSAIDDLGSEQLWKLSNEELAAELEDLHRDATALEAQRLRRLAEFDRRRACADDGYVSATAWVTHRCRVDGSTAQTQVRCARALGEMPGTRAAFTAGDLGMTQVRTLASARTAHPEAFEESEESLIKAAQVLGVSAFRRAVAYWRQALDWTEALSETNRRHDLRRLHVSRTFGGMVRIDGDLDPEAGEVVITALRSITDVPVADRGPTPAQRRADTLTEICRRWLDSAEAPQAGGERPHATVAVDLAALEDRAGAVCEADHTGVIHPETARRLVCDAGISRVITRGDSEVLDVGRRTRTVPSALRRAVTWRDRSCTFPGCDRPPAWCDVHHVVHWADGRATSQDNLVLPCRRHHRMVHEAGFGLSSSESGPVFRRPDGSLIEDRAPPRVA